MELTISYSFYTKDSSNLFSTSYSWKTMLFESPANVRGNWLSLYKNCVKLQSSPHLTVSEVEDVEAHGEVVPGVDFRARERRHLVQRAGSRGLDKQILTWGNTPRNLYNTWIWGHILVCSSFIRWEAKLLCRFPIISVCIIVVNIVFPRFWRSFYPYDIYNSLVNVEIIKLRCSKFLQSMLHNCRGGIAFV